MKPVPDHKRVGSAPRSARGVEIELQPRTWWGRLVASIVSAAILAAIFFLSLAVFVAMAAVTAVVVICLLWRRSPGKRGRIIEGEVVDRDRP